MYIQKMLGKSMCIILPLFSLCGMAMAILISGGCWRWWWWFVAALLVMLDVLPPPCTSSSFHLRSSILSEIVLSGSVLTVCFCIFLRWFLSSSVGGYNTVLQIICFLFFSICLFICMWIKVCVCWDFVFFFKKSYGVGFLV